MFNEELARNASLPKINISIPKGENPKEYLEQFFGCTATPTSEMPNDTDIDGAAVIELK